jgi:hypothetical protein
MEMDVQISISSQAQERTSNKLTTKHPKYYLRLVAGPRIGTTPSLSPFGASPILVSAYQLRATKAAEHETSIFQVQEHLGWISFRSPARLVQLQSPSFSGRPQTHPDVGHIQPCCCLPPVQKQVVFRITMQTMLLRSPNKADR